MEFFKPISLAVTTLAVLFTLCHFIKIRSTQKQYHPIAGTVFSTSTSLHDYMTQLARKYKTYRVLSVLHSEVYTSDPANVEYILKTNFKNYAKGQHQYTILKTLLGDGIFAVNGDKWLQQRKLSSHEFSTRVLRDFSSINFRENAVKLAQIISEASTSKMSMDIQDLFMKSTLDSIFKVAFGVDLDSMCGSSEEGANFANAFDESSAQTLPRYFDILWKIKRFLNVGSEARLKKKNKDDILSRFLDLNETNPQYLRDIILNFITAGKDTTAATLSWFLYMLCKHPDIQEKVAREVEKVTKEKEFTSLSQFANSLTEEALEKMQYLHAALTETLRLYPAVPVDAKMCLSDDTVPDGFKVCKGDMVAYQPYAMGRMDYIWGKDADNFRPERWLDDDGIFHSENPFKFTAFQAGPRICLGKHFAYRQIKIFSVILLGCFSFKLSDEKVKYRTMMTLHIDQGLHVCAIRR